MSTLVRPSLDAAPDLAAAAERIVERVRAAWRRSVVLRALVVGPAAAAALALLLFVVDLAVPLPASTRLILRWLPVAAALGWIAFSIYRVVLPPPSRRFALLAEERFPGLENRLVTAIDAPPPESPVARAFAAEAARRLSSADVGAAAPARVKVPGIVLAAAGGVMALFALLFPAAAAEAWGRWTDPRDAYEAQWREVRASTLPTVATPPMPVFEELRWHVSPPAYAGIAATDGRGEDQLAALPGSRVRLRSAYFGRWDAVRATRVGGGEQLPVRVDGGEWTVEWTQAPGERGVSLEALADGEVVARHVLPVAVLPDRAPDVELSEPQTDLVLATGRGRVPIRAAAADDYGVGDFRLSWSRTRGSGETFEFLEGEWQFATLRRAGKGVTGDLVLDLDGLQLQPGDVIHVRAVAMDRNDVTGPGQSVSRTRILRVARPEEMAEVNTDFGLPAELPKDPVLSQRMLIIRTERLLAQRPQLADSAFRWRSADIGYEQGRLRERVGEQIFTRSTGAMQDEGIERGFTEQGGGVGHADESRPPTQPMTPEQVLEEASAATGTGSIEEVTHAHDADPILDVDRTLLSLYNLMWAAERELNQAAPTDALPYMRRALVIIDELRKAERVYPRGRPRVDPVDLSRARGEGKIDEAAPGRRTAGAALPDVLPLLADLDRVSGRLGRTDGRRISLELSTLAARVLGDPAGDAQAAGWISRAAADAGAGRTDGARALLLRARSRLAPSAGSAGRPLPSTADPAAAEYFRRLGRMQ